MLRIEPLKRAKIFLSQNALHQNSWARTLCYLTFDLLLLVGLVYHIYITYKDWNYWEKAPNSFNIFLLIQYILMALCMRVPATTKLRQSLITDIVVLLVILLFINTIIGTMWFFELTQSPEPVKHDPNFTDVGTHPKKFQLTDEYLAHGILFVVVPWSIFIFLLIVVIKVVCFYLT